MKNLLIFLFFVVVEAGGLMPRSACAQGLSGLEGQDDEDVCWSDEELDDEDVCWSDEELDDEDVWEEEPETERDLSLPPTQEELGYICYEDGTETLITPDGAIWLAKMIDGETWGGPNEADAEAMLWSLIQRTGIWSFRTWSLQKFVQAYSQPVNPKWTRTGKYCKEYYEDDYEGNIKSNCSEKKVDRRARNIRMSWEDTDELARRYVLDFAAGRLENNLLGAVGWFAPSTWRSRENNGANDEDNMVFHSEIDGNVYFAMDRRPDTTDWQGHEVTVVGPHSMCP